MQITNVTGIPLAMAVWLVDDGYDFQRGQRKAISATSLLKSPRKILLAERLTDEDAEPIDVSDLIASRMGHSLHDGIERSWSNNAKKALRKLGIPEKQIARIHINPTPEERRASNSMLPVYLEQRTEREFMGYAITGKFDMIFDGVLNDYKSTSVYAAIYNDKDEDYQLQGSIYRWLNQDKVEADHMYINFIFTDWQRAEAKRRSDYPQQRVQQKRIELLSLAETEAWMRKKIEQLEAAADLPEEELPYCTPKDLWMSDPVFKYFSNPAKAEEPGARSTKNCATLQEARAYQASKGGKGVIVEIPGKAKACGYCNVAPICSQKDLYEHD